jgi:hypothetical protein
MDTLTNVYYDGYMLAIGVLMGWLLRTLWDILRRPPGQRPGARRERAVRLGLKRPTLPTASMRRRVTIPVVQDEDPWGRKPMKPAGDGSRERGGG